MIGCPVKTPEWNNFVERVGSEELAYAQWAENGFDIPVGPSTRNESRFESRPASKELDDKIRKFLKTIGVTENRIYDLVEADGESTNIAAVANLLYKTIEVVDERASLTTLPEEAAHFFVEILKQNNSPLYKSMFSEIESYDIYKEVLVDYYDLYKGNIEKLKEEAIAKLISSQIANTFEQESKKNRASTWFNRVLTFIKERLGLIDKEQLEMAIYWDNPFSKAAEQIYKNTINFKFQGEVFENTEEDYNSYYQLSNPKNIEDRIKEKYDISLGINGKYTRLVDGQPVEIKNRVSEKIKSPDVSEKSASQIQKEELQKITSTKGHKDLQNIVQRLVAQRDGKIAQAKVIQTDENTYNLLERYVTQMLEDLPSDARIITNTPIYDESTDTGGTPNMLVIHPNGKVDILQWRFTSLTKDGKINKFNEAIWNKQLQEYKNILAKGYGIKDFGRIRTIPIETKFQDGFLSGIRTGSQTFDSEELNPIPVTEEMTGDENLDRVLQKLVKDKTEWENKKSPTNTDATKVREFNERKYSQIAKLTKAIRDIQLRHDIKQFVKIGLETITELANTPINQYTQTRLLELQKTMQFYGKNMLGLVAEQIKDLSDIDKVDFNRLVTESQLYDTNIKNELARRQIEVNGPDLLTEQKEGGIWNRMMQTVSQQSHPIIRSFWNLVKGAKSKTREDVIELNRQIQSAITGLREAQPGKTGVDLFSFMLDKKESGQLSVISKYNKDFLKKLNTARAILKTGNRTEKATALEFIKRNTTFDSESYQKAEQEQENFLKEFYKFDEFKDEKISDRLIDFRKKNSNSEQGYSNPKNRFVRIKDEATLQSNEYKNIQSNEKLKKFYDLWMKHSKEFQDYIGKDLGGNFVWNVHNNLIDSIAENGFGAFNNMNSILDHLEARAGESLGMIDPETGKPLYEIPAYYTDITRKYNEDTKKWEVDSSNQSRDLGRVLSLVGAMAYNHKYMEEIEGSAKALELLLQNQQSVLVDNNGNETKNKLTGQIAKVLGSSDTLQQYNDYMNYYVYGVRSKTKDKIYKLPFGITPNRSYSALQTYNLTSKWFVGKALAFNPQSIIANIMGGNANIRIIGAMDKYFNNSQFNNAIYKYLPFKDKHSYALMGYFDLVNGLNFSRAANDLSVSKLTSIFTYDNLLIGQEAGDRIIRNGTLLAMLQSHTYKNGRIIKSAEGDVSLFDYIDTSKENIDFKDIPKEALERFRNKVLGVTDNVMGNNSRDDIRLAQLTVMGRALLTFRSWIPRMVDTRYGELRHNEELDTYELGRYRTFWNNVVTKQLLPIIKNELGGYEINKGFLSNSLGAIKAFGLFGYGGRYSNSLVERAKSLYAEYMEKNPMSSMTEQEYIDLHISNVKGNMMEIYITALFLSAIMAAAPDDGEKLEEGSLRRWFNLQMERNISELTFFYSPAQFNKIIKSPVPMVNVYLDLYNFGKAYVHGAEYLATGEEVKGTKKNEFRTANFKVIPGLSGFESLYSFIDDEYSKTNSIGTDSRGK